MVLSFFVCLIYFQDLKLEYRDQSFEWGSQIICRAIVKEVQTEIESFHLMLEASLIAVQLQDVRISEGDQYFL